MNDIQFQAFEELRLQNFRAFRDARLVLDDLTVLVGRNGAGKSTLLEALEFLRDAVTDSLRIAVERRGGISGISHRAPAQPGTPTISLAVVMRFAVGNSVTRLLYGFSLETLPSDDTFVVTGELLEVEGRTTLGFWRRGIQFETEVPGVSPSPVEDGLLLPLISAGDSLWRCCEDAIRGIRVYAISPSLVRLEPPVGNVKSLLREGQNAGDVLHRLQSDGRAMTWIVDYLSHVVEGIVGIRSRAISGRRLIEFYQSTEALGEQSFTAAQMSDGTLRCLAILLALKQQPSPSLLCIDELEDSIHPTALEGMVDAVLDCTSSFQVIISSHSTDMLDNQQLRGEQFRVVEWKNGVSELYPLRNTVLARLNRPDTVESVGRLLRVSGLFRADTPSQLVGELLKL